MLVIFTYNDRHWVIFTKMTQYCYSADCLMTYFLEARPDNLRDIVLIWSQALKIMMPNSNHCPVGFG